MFLPMFPHMNIRSKTEARSKPPLLVTDVAPSQVVEADRRLSWPIRSISFPCFSKVGGWIAASSAVKGKADCRKGRSAHDRQERLLTTRLLPPMGPIIAAMTVVVALAYGPQFVGVFRPPPGMFPDFVQEWLSARNFWMGESVYRPQSESIREHTGRSIDMALAWNAHPPGAVLVAVPFGLFRDYRSAHLGWNLATFPLFILAVWMVLRELRMPLRGPSLLLAVSLALVCEPLLGQLWQGQLNFVLAALLALGWAADRSEHPILSGVCLGLAAGLKLFPAFVFVYLVFARRWSALMVGITVLLGVNAAAWAAFGTETFVTYVRDVLPSLQVFRGSWRNVSATGFWTRTLASRASDLARGLAAASLLATAAVVGWRAWNARSVGERDRAFAAANLGMVLASPIAWTHYFVLLVVPIGLLWARLRSGWPRVVFLAAAATLWLPESTFAELALGTVKSREIIDSHDLPVSAAVNLLALSAFTYALALLFALIAFAPFSIADPGSRMPTEA